MKNYLFKICYDGTNYHGWQVQPNSVSVQQTVQDAIETILGKREDITGCSRTDSGVHANEFCFNMKTEKDIDIYRFTGGMNAVLPKDIAVKQIEEVPLSFHARYDSTGKEYIYKIWNEEQRNPFYEGKFLHYRRNIDEAFLNEQAQSFCGKHDFSSFCSAGGSVEDKVRTVRYFKVERNGGEVYFTVNADGFLYNMVRIMCGTLLEIQEGNIQKNTLPSVIDSLDRNRAGRTAPAHALYLNKVFYGE